MRTCPQCGHKNDGDSVFCVIDGASLDEATRVVVSLEEPEPEIQTQWVPKPPVIPVVPVDTSRPSKYGLLYALIGGLVVAVLLLGGYVLLIPRSEATAEANRSAANTPTANNAVIASNMPNVGASNPVVTTKNAVAPAMTAVANSKLSQEPRRKGYNGRVIMLNALVRLAPSDYAPAIAVIPFSQPVKIGRSAGGNSPWFRVTTVGGTTGWMHGNTIEFVR